MSGAGSGNGGVVQVGGRVAHEVVGGFSGTPALLLIMIINLAMIFAAAYFLTQQEDHRQLNVAQMTNLLQTCITRALSAEEAAKIEYRFVDVPSRTNVFRGDRDVDLPNRGGPR